MRIFVTIIAVLLLTSCTSTVSKNELILALDERISEERSHINILWYKGTKENYHHISHVYAMFGTSHYRILDSELILPEEVITPLTTDDQRWKLIYEIKNQWKSSRKHNGIWEQAPEGNILAK